ncbi:unnamed protein product, partial [Ectocarpus fasciculatus]
MAEVPEYFGSDPDTAKLDSLLDSADITTTAAATSTASERAQEVASAAVAETVLAMLDSATTMAVAAVETPAQQVLAPATNSTTSVDETTAVVPPLLSDAPELSTDNAMSSIELSGRDRGDKESFGSEEGAMLKPPEKALLSPTPQQLRNDSGTPVNSPIRSKTSRGDVDDAVVIPDVDRPNKGDANKLDDAEGAHQEEYESEGRRDGQGDSAREEGVQGGIEDGEVQDDSTERQAGRENEADNKEELGSSKDGDGRLLHHSGPEEGTTVVVSGTRKGAVVQVVERLHPSYQLIVSVRVAASTLSSVEQRGTMDESESDHHQQRRTATSEEGDNPAKEYGKATVTASLSLGKSEIKGALESWVHSSVLGTAGGDSASHHPSGATGKEATSATKGTVRTVAVTSSAAEAEAADVAADADAGLRRWITTGRPPRREHLVLWLLRRLEIVEVAVEGGQSNAANEGGQRHEDGESGTRWVLTISNREVNASEKDVGRGAGDDDNNSHDGAQGTPVRHTARRGSSRSSGGDKRGWGQGRRADAKEGQDEDHSPSYAAVHAVVDGTIAPPMAAWESAGAGGKGVSEKPLWHWWDDEDPWSRDPRSYVMSATTPTDGGPSRSGSGPPPPAYQEKNPPPPYSEAVKRYAATQRSSQTPKNGPAQHHQRTPPSREAATRYLPSGSVISSGDASSFSSGGDASLGPPPSYHSTAAGGGTAHSSSSSAAGEKDEKNRLATDLPPPSYGRFYDTHLSGTAADLSRPETNSRGEDSGGIDEWWARDEDHYFYQKSPDTQPGEERGRHRRHRSSDSGGGRGGSSRLWASGGGAIERSGADDGDRRSVRAGAGASRGRQPRHEGRGGWKRSPTASGSSRPKTTMAVSRGKSGHGNKDAAAAGPLSGTESWNDDRWRLTRYLQACQKELTEAEEGRRRAEAAANAAERRAWKTADSRGGGDDDAEKRAWARAATQRVLDLMLVTERVRQEEQKRRVAAARANNQVARCRQPFRERRGRSQKGAFIGPIVPPAEETEPRRSQQRMEAVLDDVYWDEHGRRYSRGDRGVDDAGGGDGVAEGHGHERSGEVGVAMDTVRRVAAVCLEEGTDFAQPFRDMDADGDGRLTLAEMGAALKRVGARLSLSQVTTLFRHFGRGRLGLDKVDRGEVLWEFIDTKRLLEQWRRAGDIGGGHRARTAPFRKRVKRARYGGGDDGRGGGANGRALSRYDFSRALEELGVHVDGWEAGALMDRFGVEMEEVDWKAFVSFMEAVEKDEDGKDDDDNNKDNHNGGRNVTAARDRNVTAARNGKEGRAGLRATLPRGGKDDHSFPRQQQRWATSKLYGGGGLFGRRRAGDANPPTEKAASSPKAITTAVGKPYTYWASSAPISGGRYNTASTAD